MIFVVGDQRAMRRALGTPQADANARVPTMHHDAVNLEIGRDHHANDSQ
jgi:hypothetical protein